MGDFDTIKTDYSIFSSIHLITTQLTDCKISITEGENYFKM